MDQDSNSLAKILIVEDNEADVTLIKHTLKRAKICNEVQVCSTVRSAKSLIKTFKPDIIFIDINLHLESGIDVLKFINQKKLDITPIILSHNSDRIIPAKNLGAKAYIEKPINEGRLFQFIKSVDYLHLGVFKRKEDVA